jgi:AcrR family transcriptional regulator
LYNYFPDKESILVGHFQSVIADYGMDIKQAILEGKDLKAKLYNLLDFKKGIMAEDMELTGIYLKYRMQNLFSSDPFDNPNRSGLENVVLQIIKDAQEKKEIRSDIPSITIARGFLLLTVNYFITTLTAKEPLEMDKLRDQMLELFLTGANA